MFKLRWLEWRSILIPDGLLPARGGTSQGRDCGVPSVVTWTFARQIGAVRVSMSQCLECMTVCSMFKAPLLEMSLVNGATGHSVGCALGQFQKATPGRTPGWVPWTASQRQLAWGSLGQVRDYRFWEAAKDRAQWPSGFQDPGMVRVPEMVLLPVPCRTGKQW